LGVGFLGGELATFRCIPTAKGEQLSLLCLNSFHFPRHCVLFCSIVAFCLHSPELVSPVGSGEKVFSISPCGLGFVVLLPDHSCSASLVLTR
jgi:hypothetical protein